MTLAIIASVIGLFSIWASAYLLRLWHDDEADLRARGKWRGGLRTWPFSRVLAYVGAGATTAAVYLAALTVGRLVVTARAGAETWAPATMALTPLTIAAIFYLLLAVPVVALYLRFLKGRNHRKPDEAPSQLPSVEPKDEG